MESTDADEALQHMKWVVQDLQAGEATVRQRLDLLEERLQREVQKEQTVREAGLRELREEVGGQQTLTQDYLSSMKEILVRENEVRLSHLSSTMDFLNQRAATCEGRIQDLQERLAAEVAARERQCSAVQAFCEERLRSQLDDAQERLERTERQAASIAVERSEKLQASFDCALREHHSSVRECISGLERLLQEFVDEHARAQGATRDDFTLLDQQVTMRFAEERACREAAICELRERLTRSASPTSEPQQTEAELCDRLSAEASARHSAALSAVTDLLVTERKAVEERVAALREALTREADARDARAREANAAALQDLLIRMDDKLQREFQREQEGRATDVRELRKLVADGTNSHAEILSSVNKIMSREQEVKRSVAVAQESLEQRVAERLATLEDSVASCKAQQLPEGGEKDSMAGLLQKADKDFEVRFSGHQDKVLRAQKELLLTQNSEVEGHFRVLSEKFEAQLQVAKEGLESTWKDQLRSERTVWEQQHETLRGSLASERDARERSLAAMQALIQRGNEDHLRLERQIREKLQRPVARDRSLEFGSADSEELSIAERAALEQTTRELLAVERGARERSYASLHNLLKCESEAMRSLLDQERETRAAGHSALKDAIQREREARERHAEKHREELAYERVLREEGQKALSESVKEQQVAREEEKLDQQRIESLERTACIFDGLVRAERAERTAESRRLWDALDSHTHDLRKQRVLTPPAPPPAAVTVPVGSGALRRTTSVSPGPPPASMRCFTPPCPAPVAVQTPGPSHTAAAGCSSLLAAAGAAQRALPSQRQLLPAPSLPVFIGGPSPAASPGTEATTPLLICGSVSTLNSEATTSASPCNRRSTCASASMLLSPQSGAALQSETITCGSTRYHGEPQSVAEVLSPL